jgi:hypothetical protein
MKANIITSISFIVLSVQIYVVYTEVKTQKSITDLEAENNDLKNEVLKYEHLYLKCQGDSVTERMGAHYVDGKIKFYEY